jgi:hypothetical protein
MRKAVNRHPPCEEIANFFAQGHERKGGGLLGRLPSSTFLATGPQRLRAVIKVWGVHFLWSVSSAVTIVPVQDVLAA